jgi:peptidylprolyl isomerase
MNTKVIVSLVVVVVLAITAYMFYSQNHNTFSMSENNNSSQTEASSTSDGGETRMVVLKTNMGDITLELFTGKMPITTGNFLTLAEEGFYNETKFHRIIKGFMIQGGDPNSRGDDTATYGRGGPGYTIEDEFADGLSNVTGTISMANTGRPDSGGSQFFINVADNTGLDFDKEPLTSKHPVFGRVIEGMDVVNIIQSVPTGAGDMPVEPVVIEEIQIK